MELSANQPPAPIILLCPAGSEGVAGAVKASLSARGEAAELFSGTQEPDTLGESLVGRRGRLYAILKVGGHGDLAERRLRFHLESNGVPPTAICTLLLDGAPPGSIADRIQDELLQEQPDLEDQVTQRVDEKIISDLMVEVEESKAAARTSRSGTQLGIPGPRQAPPPTAAPGRPPPAPTATRLGHAAADDDDLLPAGRPIWQRWSTELLGRPVWQRWGIAGASLLGLVVISLAFAYSGDDDTPKDSQPTVAVDQTTPPPPPAEPHAPQPQPAPAPEPTPPEEAAQPPAAEPEPPPEPEPEPEPEPADSIAIEEAPEAEPLSEDLVAKALRKRKFRALDALLVSYVAMKRRNYTQAEQYCAELEVGGVVGWRLPDVGEVMTLSRARMLSRRTYWTRTAGDTTGARRLAWNAARRRIYPLRVKWRGGRTVCVRER